MSDSTVNSEQVLEVFSNKDLCNELLVLIVKMKIFYISILFIVWFV